MGRRLASMLVVCTLSAGCARAPAPPPPAIVERPAFLERSPPIAAPVEAAPESGLLRIVFRTSNRRDVPSRFGGGDHDIMQTFAVEVATQPPQRLLVGDVRQTLCHLREYGESLTVGPHQLLTCNSGSVHFDVTFARLPGERVEVTAAEQIELAPAPLRSWTVGVLRIPFGRPIHVSLIDEHGSVEYEFTHEPGL